MAISLDSLTPADAMHFLCFALAQSEDPHRALGYQTQNEAFEDIANRFGSKANTVKNNRDSFDRFTDSARVGWKSELRPALSKIYEAVKELSRDEIFDLSRTILQMSWYTPMSSAPKDDQATTPLKDIFGLSNTNDNLIKVREPYLGAAITFSNTHSRNNDAWFVLTADQIKQSLIDILPQRAKFPEHYNEGIYRALFAEHLTDDVARYMASVQTMPFFEVLSKVIHYSGRSDDRISKKIDLSEDSIRQAILELEQLAVKGTPAANSMSREGSRNEHATSVIGTNRIYYGAPGTGKSYAVNALVGEANVIRTVFHPDTQNSDFFGCLKPAMDGDKVTYHFAPGPLSRALSAAMIDTAHQHYLVIEELNRAPAAAVFGELFQLLDRDDSGAGEYEVDFPNGESRDWFKSKGYGSEKLVMPANLSIIATMNSADQGVYPLDTAFRRRWEQQYLPLYEGNGPQGDVSTYVAPGQEIRLSWKTFVQELNNWLIELDLAEDRLLGLWFAKERELGKHVPAKILLYLWDDLLRHEGRERLFASHIKTYGGLDQAIKAGKPIFIEGFLNALKARLPSSAANFTPAPEETTDAKGQ
ncbi:AAA family ATPase [Marivivens sp. LCG002]|uniref:AAA family ATPase n=1 Tax=Marivivens sp. LCG002 TaxID=3051171 RepID=UPI0025559ADF|nr:AAA family ATPase [Marivivens sp. LCG002]WIV50278.1 AAA family ATPase [Marivivens sp. LCG002]